MSNTIAKQYARLLALWPKDPLRPNLPFTRAIEFRAAPYGVKPIAPTEEGKPASKPDSASSPALSKLDPALEKANINALFSLLENRYSKKYPITQDVLKPKSNPEHYDRLMEEIARAPTKSWLSAKIDEWKMKIRWQ
ncbi:hypothetical protein BS50DRAFT_603497 [Corynespora cassiicola Philippines]|uniref:Uncharacterized protein n=1 Tax=Corynespora cassiicola Philippines TaxID=1448308 RepID=A0A2T2NBR0_CORCC|nr:hypothetical protein BS50DRAFT_603497 [Corynespora cassiicola Philippines]